MAQVQIRTAEILIGTYGEVLAAWGSQPYPMNVAPTLAALDAGLAEIARIKGERDPEVQ